MNRFTHAHITETETEAKQTNTKEMNNILFHANDETTKRTNRSRHKKIGDETIRGGLKKINQKLHE